MNVHKRNKEKDRIQIDNMENGGCNKFMGNINDGSRPTFKFHESVGDEHHRVLNFLCL